MLIHFLHAYSRESVIRFHSTHFPGMPPIFHADGIYTRNYCYGFIKKQRFRSHRNGAPFQSFVSNPSLKLALRLVALQSDPAAPSCLQMQVINMSACKAFPSLRTINRRCSENLFYQPFWVYTYGDVISVVAQRRTITWNGFGVSLVSFLASFQETDKHKSDITLIHRSWGVSILVLLSPVRLSSHLDTSSRYGLPWWLRWYRICLQCGRP